MTVLDRRYLCRLDVIPRLKSNISVPIFLGAKEQSRRGDKLPMIGSTVPPWLSPRAGCWTGESSATGINACMEASYDVLSCIAPTHQSDERAACPSSDKQHPWPFEQRNRKDAKMYSRAELSAPADCSPRRLPRPVRVMGLKSQLVCFRVLSGQIVYLAAST